MSQAGPASPVIAYVTSGSGVSPINTANKAGKLIKIAGGDGLAVAVTPDGKTAYVTGSAAATRSGSPLTGRSGQSRSGLASLPSL